MGFWSTVNKRTLGAAKNIALTPIAPLYALGAGVNSLTGGKTETYSVWKAASGKAKPPVYSTFTQAASGYQGKTPSQGKWAVPVINQSSAKVTGQVVSTVVKEVAAPVANAAAEGLFGVSLRTVAIATAGVGVGLAGLYIVTRPGAAPIRRR